MRDARSHEPQRQVPSAAGRCLDTDGLRELRAWPRTSESCFARAPAYVQATVGLGVAALSFKAEPGGGGEAVKGTLTKSRSDVANSCPAVRFGEHASRFVCPDEITKRYLIR
jgi:hypothetical protein